MRNYLLLILIPIACFIVSCATNNINSRVVLIPGRSYASLPADSSVSIITEAPGKPYYVIAEITTEGYSGVSFESMADEVKKQARGIGGEAVLVLPKDKKKSDKYPYVQFRPRAISSIYGFGSDQIIYTPEIEGKIIRFK